jgi:hypothetical protein
MVKATLLHRHDEGIRLCAHRFLHSICLTHGAQQSTHWLLQLLFKLSRQSCPATVSGCLYKLFREVRNVTVLLTKHESRVGF